MVGLQPAPVVQRPDTKPIITRPPESRKPAVKPADTKPAFDEKDMIRPINQFREYPIDDYRKLPNCLDVFADCVAVPFEGKTEEQYKTALSTVAGRPCRLELKLVDVSASYDYGTFEILADDGGPGLTKLKQGGDLGKYSRYLKAQFAINNVKAKGLDSQKRSIGDRITLVGLGNIVAAVPWGAATPTDGVPKGNSRRVTLRAFGKPSRYHASEYEFAFMVRNWYIAAQ